MSQPGHRCPGHGVRLAGGFRPRARPVSRGLHDSLSTASAFTCSRHCIPPSGGGSQRSRFCVSSTPGITSISPTPGTSVTRLWSVNTMKSYPCSAYHRTTASGGVSLSPDAFECRCSCPLSHPAEATGVLAADCETACASAFGVLPQPSKHPAINQLATLGDAHTVEVDAGSPYHHPAEPDASASEPVSASSKPSWSRSARPRSATRSV